MQGQDTMIYLREVLGIPIESLLWVMPNSPWITARDPPKTTRHNTCMEFISTLLEAHTVAGSPAGAATTAEFMQRGFEKAYLPPHATSSPLLDITHHFPFPYSHFPCHLPLTTYHMPLATGHLAFTAYLLPPISTHRSALTA